VIVVDPRSFLVASMDDMVSAATKRKVERFMIEMVHTSVLTERIE
jgi:hypothetical protein